jgi:hypothetical protein
MKKSSQNQDFNIAMSKIKAVIYYKVEFDFFGIANHNDLRKKLSKLKDYKFKEFNPDEEEVKNILKYGLSSIVNPDYEHFVGKPQTRREDFIQAMQKFLDYVLKGNSLIIIDPYIFPKKYDSSYPEFLVDILKKYLLKLKRITFITSASYHQDLQQKIFSDIQAHNSQINITLKQTEVFHDRFWISPRNRKGVFMGTSLNGIGKKYTLIDYIQEEDVREILGELKKNKF